jgi:hypothetical protein
MPVEHVLLFGADIMIWSKLELSLDNFLKYDFIGRQYLARTQTRTSRVYPSQWDIILAEQKRDDQYCLEDELGEISIDI